MSNMIETAKRAISKAMAYRFPKYPVRFENIEDDSRILGLGVFAVPSFDFVSVQNYVFDLEASGLLPEGWELLPLVRDPVATRTHYPDILVPWSVATLCDIASHVTDITGHASSVRWNEFSDGLAVAHMVPFVREFIASTTNRMPVPPLMMRPVNAFVLVEDYQKRAAEKAASEKPPTAEIAAE